MASRATAVSSPTPHDMPADDDARAARLTSFDQAVGSPLLCSTSPPAERTRASDPASEATARASGTAARPPGTRPADHDVPSLALRARGEKRSASLGSMPTSNDPPATGLGLATRPPLSATPGGVSSVHRDVASGRKKSCQKVLSGSLSVPMATTATTPEGVAKVASRATWTAGGDPWKAVVSGVGLEQPATPLAAARSVSAPTASGERDPALLTRGQHVRALTPGTRRTTKTTPTRCRARC